MDASGGQGPGPFGPGSPGYGPGGGSDEEEDETQRARPEAPQQQPSEPQPPPPLWSAPQNAEAPPGPQSPAPGGPQSPAPGPQAPPPPGPQSPAGAPPPPGYGGPVPPGGWQQPQPTFVPQGELASWGSRLGAYLLDWLIVIVVLAAGGIVIAGVVAANEVAGIVVGIVLGIALLAVFLGYWSFLTARKGDHNGQTWGKQAVGIRVIRDDGRPMDVGSSLLRELVLQGVVMHVVSWIIPLIPWFLNYFWPLWDDSNRALHDMIVSTHVIRA